MTVALDHGTPPNQILGEREPRVRAGMAQIAELWRTYRAGGRTAEQIGLADKFDGAYTALVREVIEPALGLVRNGDKSQLNELFGRQAPALFQAVFDTNRTLVEAQIKTGEAAYVRAAANLRWRVIAGLIGDFRGHAGDCGPRLDTSRRDPARRERTGTAFLGDHSGEYEHRDRTPESTGVRSCDSHAAGDAGAPRVRLVAARRI